MKIYLATWLEDTQGNGPGESLTRMESKKRLLSYHLIKTLQSDFLPIYI